MDEFRAGHRPRRRSGRRLCDVLVALGRGCAEALWNWLGAGVQRLVLEWLTADHMARSFRALYDALPR